MEISFDNEMRMVEGDSLILRSDELPHIRTVQETVKDRLVRPDLQVAYLSDHPFHKRFRPADCIAAPNAVDGIVDREQVSELGFVALHDEWKRRAAGRDEAGTMTRR